VYGDGIGWVVVEEVTGGVVFAVYVSLLLSARSALTEVSVVVVVVVVDAGVLELRTCLVGAAWNSIAREYLRDEHEYE
jgi:hypothetical protein